MVGGGHNGIANIARIWSSSRHPSFSFFSQHWICGLHLGCLRNLFVFMTSGGWLQYCEKVKDAVFLCYEIWPFLVYFIFLFSLLFCIHIYYLQLVTLGWVLFSLANTSTWFSGNVLGKKKEIRERVLQIHCGKINSNPKEHGGQNSNNRRKGIDCLKFYSLCLVICNCFGGLVHEEHISHLFTLSIDMCLERASYYSASFF